MKKFDHGVHRGHGGKTNKTPCYSVVNSSKMMIFSSNLIKSKPVLDRVWGGRGYLDTYHNMCYYYDRYSKEEIDADSTSNSPCFGSQK